MKEIRTAVAAAASVSVRKRIIYLLATCGIRLLSMSDNGAQALKCVEYDRPDLLIADVHLPILCGSSLILRAIKFARMPVRPESILLYNAQFPVLYREELEQQGVIPLEKPASPASFASAVQRLQASTPVFPEQVTFSAEQLLTELGFPMHVGRDCLRDAALIAASDQTARSNLSKYLYPQLAAIHRLEPAQVERAIRHAIGLAWQSDKFENQYRIFADTVDARRGQPTCREMICRLADILRLEGL